MNPSSRIEKLPRYVLYYGEDRPLSEPIRLRAGPLSLLFDQADLRRISLGDHEILRRIYVAVRDRFWNTLPTRLFNLCVEAGTDSFRLSFEVENSRDEIDFYWKGRIEGNSEGKIRYTMEGETCSAFMTNRIGVCILHPIKECAGRPCMVEHIDGSTEATAFPLHISPHQPFLHVRAMTHDISPGLSAEVRFEGDTFETEDQRNWTDDSYKTYCPPLDIPFPIRVEPGRKITHSITLSIQGCIPETSQETSRVSLSVKGSPLRELPSIGLSLDDQMSPLSEREAARLKSLNPGHLRVDLRLWQTDHETVLEHADSTARSLATPLEVALFLSDAAEEELRRLLQILERVKPSVARWLVFHISERSTSARWVRLARSTIRLFYPGAKMGAGSNIYFAELNRRRPTANDLDFVCYPINPQVHASDRATIIENLEAQGATVENARYFSEHLPVVVTPITFKPRLNPNIGPARPAPAPGTPPANVDVRQMSLFAAGWTIGSIKSLSQHGASSLTYYETIGWRGVMELEQGSPMPQLFRSFPGSVFPVYFIFLWVGPFAGGSTSPVVCSHPLKAVAICLSRNGDKRILLANLEATATRIQLEGLGEDINILRLNETNVEEAMLDPEKFLTLPGEAYATVAGGLTLEMLPFEIVRIDFLVVKNTEG